MSSVLRQKEFFWGALLNVANVGLMAGGMVQQSGQAKEQAKQAEVQAQKMDAQNAALNRIAKTQGGNPSAPVQMAQAMQERVRDFSDTRGSIMFRHREPGINRGELFIGESLFSDVFMEKYFGRPPIYVNNRMKPTRPQPNKNLASVMSGQNKKTTGQVLNTSTTPGNTRSTPTKTPTNPGGNSIMSKTPPTNRFTSGSTQNSFKKLDVNNLSYNGKKLTPTTPGNSSIMSNTPTSSNTSYTYTTPTNKGGGTVTLGTTTNSSWSGSTNTSNMKTPASTGARASIMKATGLGKNGIPLKSAAGNNTGPSIYDLTKGLPFKSPTGADIRVSPLKRSTPPPVMSNKGGSTPTKTPSNSINITNTKIPTNTGNSIMRKTPGNISYTYTTPSKTGNSNMSYTTPTNKTPGNTGNKGGSTGQQKGNQKNGNGNKNQQGQQRSGGNNSPGNNTSPGNNGGDKVNVPDWARELYGRGGNSSGSQNNSTGNSSIMSNTPTNTSGNTQNTGQQNQQNQGNTGKQNPPTSNETAPTPTNTESSNNTSGTQQPAQQTEGDTGGGGKNSGRLRRLGGKLATAGKWAGGLAAAGTLATAGAGLYYTKKAFDDD